ncbi:protein of unknown function [Trujillonella endophytica]|uniref:HNH nuclease domain-containing protein n=1 Tax=Trujillonella endophytica TaxID=673521 RepID=A0A1H8SDK2_9ACTN|nr:protein of unknown function [Trujillella endophytica]
MPTEAAGSSCPDLFGLGLDELAGRVRDGLAAVNRAAAELTRLVRMADARQLPERDGLRSMTSWLVGHAGMAPAAAARVVAHGRALAHLPAMDAAYAAGAVTGEHVTEAAKAVTPRRLGQAADAGIDVGRIDAALATVATCQPFAKLGEAVERYLAQLDPDGPEPDPAVEREFTMTTHADGSVSGRFHLDAVGGAKVKAAIEPIAATSRTAGDDRTRRQRYGDALVQLSDLALAGGELPVLRTRKPQIGAIVGLDALVDPDVGRAAGQLDVGALLSAARARWLACDSDVARIVLGPDGVLRDLGREHRVVDRHLRRAVDLRDNGCVFTGCTAPPWWCEAHHLLHWAFGGKTELENLASLCERHHAKVHHGYRIERLPDGTWRTRRPDGTQIHIPHRLPPEDPLIGHDDTSSAALIDPGSLLLAGV